MISNSKKYFSPSTLTFNGPSYIIFSLLNNGPICSFFFRLDHIFCYICCQRFELLAEVINELFI